MSDASSLRDPLSRRWFQHYDPGVLPTVSPFDKPLFALLDEAATRYPDRLALIFQNTRITYRQLQHKAEMFAASLRLLGVNPGDRVAIMLPNLPQTIIAFWGIMKAGGMAVMTNPLYMETEIIQHIQDSGAEHLIMLDLLWPKIDALRDRLPLRSFIVTSIAEALSFPMNYLYKFNQMRERKLADIPYDDMRILPWKEMFSTGKRFSASHDMAPYSVAILQYTGGTTGLPKGVMLTHASAFPLSFSVEIV